ncbi:hypothetical protein IG631_10151 [Alternaria alternata]|nr:hypothetical protein IG631_10151 [Alternaria alternata]
MVCTSSLAILTDPGPNDTHPLAPRPVVLIAPRLPATSSSPHFLSHVKSAATRDDVSSDHSYWLPEGLSGAHEVQHCSRYQLFACLIAVSVSTRCVPQADSGLLQRSFVPRGSPVHAGHTCT